jgi:hypothetical protein
MRSITDGPTVGVADVCTFAVDRYRPCVTTRCAYCGQAIAQFDPNLNVTAATLKRTKADAFAATRARVAA